MAVFSPHVVPYDPTRFEAASTADLVRPLGLTVADPTPRLRLTAEERREGDRLREGADLAIQPGARYDLKRLPIAVLCDAARAWQDEGRRLVMVGGPEERPETDALIAALDRPVVDLVGRCGVRETMAVLAGSSVAVGADTGVMHLAVAVGCPTVQAFGPTPTDKWGHAYGPHRIVHRARRLHGGAHRGRADRGGRRPVRRMGGGRAGATRLLALLLLALLPSLLLAQDALILIQHDKAGPNLPSADVIHGEWIRWPENQPNWNNRILALAGGVDLQGEAADMSLKPRRDGWIAYNGRRLRARGFFAARAAYLRGVPTTIVGNATPGVSSSVLFLGLDGPSRVVRIQPFGAPMPPFGLVVYEAVGWDDAIAVSRRVSGRSLIVEYPPAGDDGWSRYWLRGPWPPGVPTEADVEVPGLVRARRALALLLRPGEFRWRPGDPGAWGGPNRWLEHGRGDTPWVLGGWFALATFVIAWALAQVMNEDRGPFVSEMLALVALSPAALVLAGAAARVGGLEAWPVWLALAAVATYGRVAPRRARRPSRGAGRAPAPARLPRRLGDPRPPRPPLVRSLESLRRARPGRAGPRARGVRRLSRGRDGVRPGTGVRSGPRDRGDPLGRDGTALVDRRPLRPPHPAGRRAARLGRAVPPPDARRPRPPADGAPPGAARQGVAWNAGGLLAFADEGGSLDLRLSARLLGSPEWGGFLAFAATVALVGNRFLAYRLRRQSRLDPRLRVLPWTAAGALALGVTEPLALPIAPIVAFGALVALAYDGLRANA